MDSPGEFSDSQLWTFTAEVPVQAVAMAAEAGVTAVVDAARKVVVLDQSGAMLGQFKASFPVRRVRINGAGSLLVALVGDGVLYAFGPDGRLEWRVELDGKVADFAMDAAAKRVVAVTGEGKLHIYLPESHQRYGLSTAMRPRWVALGVMEEDLLCIAFADEGGRIGIADGRGEVLWERELSACAGPVSLSAAAELLAVPAHERGLLLFKPNGDSAGVLDLKAPVVKAAVAPDGSQVMAQTADARLVLAGADTRVRWEKKLDWEPADWALGMGGLAVAVAGPGTRVMALRLSAEPTVRVEVPSGTRQVEKTIDTGARLAGTVVGSCKLLWKRRLQARVAPADSSWVRLSPDGRYLLMVLPDHYVVMLDEEGQPIVRTYVEGEFRIAPCSQTSRPIIWTEREALFADGPQAKTWTVEFRDSPGVTHLDCSANGRFFCTADRSGKLTAYSEDGSPLWRKDLDGLAVDLLVSPEGKTVLVSDSSGRYRHYALSGELLRKFRFASPEGRRALALAEGFAAYGTPSGVMTVLDVEGRPLWSGRPVGKLVGLEVFGQWMAIYGPGGVSAIVEPVAGSVWPFRPPPCKACYARKDASGRPVLVHASGRAVTAFQGFERQLEVLWRLECDEAVNWIEADAAARFVIATAGNKLHRIESLRTG